MVFHLAGTLGKHGLPNVSAPSSVAQNGLEPCGTSGRPCGQRSKAVEPRPSWPEEWGGSDARGRTCVGFLLRRSAHLAALPIPAGTWSRRTPQTVWRVTVECGDLRCPGGSRLPPGLCAQLTIWAHREEADPPAVPFPPAGRVVPRVHHVFRKLSIYSLSVKQAGGLVR